MSSLDMSSDDEMDPLFGALDVVDDGSSASDDGEPAPARRRAAAAPNPPPRSRPAAVRRPAVAAATAAAPHTESDTAATLQMSETRPVAKAACVCEALADALQQPDDSLEKPPIVVRQLASPLGACPARAAAAPNACD